MVGFIFWYLLGAFTFWPLLGVTFWYLFQYLDSLPQSEQSLSTSAAEAEDDSLDHPVSGSFSPQESLQSRLDRESNTEANGWIRLAPTYINKSDPYENPDSKKDDSPAGITSRDSAKGSLRKFMSSRFFSNTKRRKSESSSEYAASSVSSINTDVSKIKSVSKCPKYWAVVRGGQLQLFEDANERKVVEIVIMPKFIVMLWPQTLQEFELFYKRYPICLVNRTEPQGLVSLDLYPGIPPRDAYYIYVENPSDKEDLYFALIKESSRALSDSLDPKSEKQSLGPRDPAEMARPYRALKSESQQLLSSVWNSEATTDTQWLNGLLGRIFLAVKNTPVLDGYLRRKFNYKLKPISDSSNIIGDIEIKSIDCGTAAPLITNVKLRELTTDGSLVASAGISYSGGFKVILATQVKLAAISSLTSAEIPVVLAATVSRLEGNMMFKIKPPPSDRLWYAFEAMPDVDLQIVPTVYDKHISLSVVTKFIRSKLLESLKDSLVTPFMDDFSFYNSTESFYKGGIWFPQRPVRKDPVEQQLRQQQQEQEQQEQPQPQQVLPQEPSQERPLEPLPEKPQEPSQQHAIKITETTKSPVSNTGVSTTMETSVTESTSEPTNATSVTGATNGTSLQKANSSSPTKQSTPLDSPEPTKSNAVRQARSFSSASQISPKSAVPPNDVLANNAQYTAKILPGVYSEISDEEYAADLSQLPNSGSFDTSHLLNISPVSVRRGSRATTTTQVTATSASAAPEGFETREGSTSASSRATSSSPLPTSHPATNAVASTGPAPHKVARKPVPAPQPSDKLELPLFAHADASTEVSNEIIGGELTDSDSGTALNATASLAPQRAGLHRRTDSRPQSIRSIRSNVSGSSKAPSLPPRNRRIVPLANVPPEHL